MPTASAVDEAAPAPSLSSLEALERIRAKLIRPMPTDRLRGWLLPLAVTILGGIARFWHITRPGGHALQNGLTTKQMKSLVFDETYYAHDSWTMLHHGVEANGAGNGPGFVVHPPLGKWMMAVGEAIFDHGKQIAVLSNGPHKSPTIYPASPLSFRFMGALLGTIAILMMARIARRMFRSTTLGVIAGVLFSLDGLEFVQSRTAMLDIYLMFWVIAAFGCLILDRDHSRQRLADRLDGPIHPSEWGPSLGFRPWRWATALCIGAACATKWDGAFYLVGFLLLAIAWDFGMRRTAGARTGLIWGALYSVIGVSALFILVPAAVYVASWTGWFMSNAHYAYDHDLYTRRGQSWFSHDVAVFHGWWHYQQEIWGYDKDLTWTKNPHPYLSRPWGWLFLARPVAYYYVAPHNACGMTGSTYNQCSSEILGIGNPAIWWMSIPAFIGTAWAWVARRDWRASAILVMFLVGYVPWCISDFKQRVMFLFYMLPNVPFMVLAITMLIGMAIGRQRAATWRRTIGLAGVSVYLATVVVLFGFFYPVLSAQTMTYTDWHKRIWFHHCQTDANQHQENAPCWI